MVDDGNEALEEARMSVFRIHDDGKLSFARKCDVAVGATSMFWMRMVELDPR